MSIGHAILKRDPAGLPSRRDEDWRWTDVRGLVRNIPPPSEAHDHRLPPGPFAGAAVEELALVNGRGVESVEIAAGETRRIALRLVNAGKEGSHAAETAIAVGEGARLLLLESHETLGEGHLAAHALTMTLDPGAHVERIVLADRSEADVALHLARVRLSAGARFTQTVVTCGARRQRLETHVEHPGAGAKVRLDGAYLVGDRRHADITTLVTHAGVDGTTDQLVKGAVRDQGRGVFQGRIVVSPGADRTDARMGHHGLILSDRAEIDAKPELEIYADDVACAHGNTVGALDEDALFYARQRGIGEDEARALLIRAFVGEVVGRVEDFAASEHVAVWLDSRLARTS